MDNEVALFGRDIFGDVVNPATAPLKQRFIIPPFSVLDARQGEWQSRKRAWIKIGIKSEVGRGAVQGSLESVRRLQKGMKAAPGGSAMPAMDYSKGERGDGKGRPIRSSAAMSDAKLKQMIGFNVGVDTETVEKVRKRNRAVAIECHFDHNKKREEREGDDAIETWVVSSIFDPVLCELAYRWWCPVGGQVIDPFAGGSVRGIVAGCLGKKYWGCDLRPEQIEANEEQANLIKTSERPVWVCGDSRDMLPSAPDADMIFSCPPYGNLEVYSDDPRDISSMDFREFVKAYKEIIKKSCDRLKNNRFACFVVADFRDDEGHYRNFVSGTIKSFQDCGLKLYNEIVLITVVGTASLRATKQFNSGRKVVKTHQNVLVFVKGDWKVAAKACVGEEK